MQRFTALQSGEVDVLCRNATWTLGRDTELGLEFAQVNYYDGQGFMVPKKLKIKNAKELDGATVCVLPGTTTELNVADYFRVNKMKMKPVVIENAAELYKAFFAGRCDVLTSDASQLAGTRAVAPKPDDYVILPDIISKEPLAPAVRQGDNQWKDIVNFSVLAMIEAEDLGNHLEERRRDAQEQQSRGSAVSGRHRRQREGPRDWTKNGPTTSSSRSETTRKYSNAVWGRTPPSSWSAA